MRSYLLTSSLLLSSAAAAGIYPKGGPVLNLDFKSYETQIAKSNYTSIVEYYAPWCGHCQNLKPAYEKAAKQLAGLAKVAAINCDDEENKPFCGSMQIKGFPTLKIVRPNTKKAGGRPFVEDYQGGRTAKAIVEAVMDKIPNHVSRPKAGELETWVKSEGPKAILFSNKGTVSALLKSLAIDYLGSISVAQVRDTDKEAVKQYGVTKFPTLVLLQGGDVAPVTYTGEMEKAAMLDFLKTAAQPNPDPPAKKAKETKTNKAKASKDSSSLAQASASQAAAQGQPSQQAETLVNDGPPMPSPDPKISDEKPIKAPQAAAEIEELKDGLSLQQKCLNNKAGTCILLYLPEPNEENPYPEQALGALEKIVAKHSGSGRKLFPFYQLPKSNSEAQASRRLLKLDDGMELIAINGKKSWWRRYEDAEYEPRAIEAWIDEIRMGEGAKQKIPKTLIVDVDELPGGSAKAAGNEETLADKIKAQLPEGVQVQMDEIDDSEYEKIMAESGKAGKDEL